MNSFLKYNIYSNLYLAKDFLIILIKNQKYLVVISRIEVIKFSIFKIFAKTAYVLILTIMNVLLWIFVIFYLSFFHSS